MDPAEPLSQLKKIFNFAPQWEQKHDLPENPSHIPNIDCPQLGIVWLVKYHSLA
jgi:hypothetical protein